MTKNDEFDKDFDFEKEYGFDPKTLLDPEYESDDAMKQDFDASYDQAFIKDFDDKFGADFDEKFAEEFGVPVQEAPAETPATFQDEVLEEEGESLIPDFVNTKFPSDEPTKVLPAFDLPEFDEKVIDQSVFEDSAAEAPAPDAEEPQAQPGEAPVQEAAPQYKPRRKPMSTERLIKEVYLPPIIAGLTAVLCLIFIIGGITRAIKANPNKDKESVSSTQEDEATRLQREAQQLLEEATALANGYDYQAALDKLNSFSDADNMDKYPAMIAARSEYATLKDQVQAWNEPSSITNLSFHTLIVDPTRAFTDKQWGASYLMNFVTVDEFNKILDQIYANGYVLVDFDSFVEEVEQEDGTVTYKTKPIYLPAGKKPFMLSTTLVNYFDYMISKDEDGEYGDGFASKLIIDNGKLTNEYVDAAGNTIYGAYDLIPILEEFIAEHSDFAYKGARALVSFTGEEGVFGYRTMPSVIQSKGQEYYDNEVANAKAVAQKLRDLGYTLCCGSYGNEHYGNDFSATQIKEDIDLWLAEVTPVIGEVDTIIYARGSDITTGNSYTGNKYNVLQTAGFRYFVGAADVAWAEVTNSYVRQTRIMVTGQMLKNAASTFTSFFDAKTVMCVERNLAS